jgi:hypothetical protein
VHSPKQRDAASGKEQLTGWVFAADWWKVTLRPQGGPRKSAIEAKP